MKVIFVLLLLSTTSAFSQINSIPFHITWRSEHIILQKNYYSASLGDSIRFSELRVYITNVIGYVHGKAIDLIPSYLFDIETNHTATLSWKKKLSLDSLSFTLGVDSITNVSGAMGGALDPMNGMYWTWQSGYINCKVEGNSPACHATKNLFQYHLGGYSFPYNSSQNMGFRVKNSSPVLEIKLDEWFDHVPVKEMDHIMSPSKTSVALLKNLSDHIILK